MIYETVIKNRIIMDMHHRFKTNHPCYTNLEQKPGAFSRYFNEATIIKLRHFMKSN